MAVENVAAEHSSEDEEKQQVEQVQIAHGLEWPQPLEARWKHDDESNDGLEDAVVNQSLHDWRRGGAVGCVSTIHPMECVEQNEGSEDTEPFVPVPAGKKIKAASGGGLTPRVGSRFKDPTQRDEQREELERGCSDRCNRRPSLDRTARGGCPHIVLAQIPEQECTERNSEAGHDRVNGKGEGQQYACDPEAAIKNGDDGSQDGRSGECARMKILIGEIDRGAGDRQRQ